VPYPVKITCPSWALRIQDAIDDAGGPEALLQHLVDGTRTAVAYPIDEAANGQLQAIPSNRWLSEEAAQWLASDLMSISTTTPLPPGTNQLEKTMAVAKSTDDKAMAIAKATSAASTKMAPK
jgi:hypothetical protein